MSTETNTVTNTEGEQKEVPDRYKSILKEFHRPGIKHWVIETRWRDAQMILREIGQPVSKTKYFIEAQEKPDDMPCTFIYIVAKGDIVVCKTNMVNMLELASDSAFCSYTDRAYFVRAVREDEMLIKNMQHIQVTAPPHNESVKNDILDGKLPWELLPMATLEPVVEVYGAGAKKYGPNRWQYLENGFERYRAAALRHLNEYMKGNRYDSDTGCQHLAQFVWNGIAMLNYDMRGMGAIPGNAKEGDDMLTADGVQKVHRLPPHDGAVVDINEHLRSAIKSAVDTVNPLQEG